ncbi:alpha/beta hydrolase [Georgenia wutianyii]|uniref:Alpha/beta hydrolase n=1 Tax=Georgenia wutianyii TaxID=2585135 RepID=A0ABX5VLB2_9MICO|nr:alpha/beta hydrolase [Georgenia wutianyii]QDB78098.1 alpha/beta hydrolase [Georgenia wutianyii]
MAPLENSLWQDGPWEHRFVAANGARFHVVLAGPEGGDLVVLLHGFPQFWWAWRAQVRALAEAGYRVAAMDIRGFGGSDKPPTGHAMQVLTADVGGVVRSLGHENAVVVGHDLGGLLAWSMPVLEPRTTRAVVVLGAPHPVPLLRPNNHLGVRARLFLTRIQAPWFPERALRHGNLVDRLLTDASAPGRVLPEDELRSYRAGVRLPSVAHTTLEHLRWLVRSTPRPAGRRYLAAMASPVTVPVLSVRGGADRFTPSAAFASDAQHVRGPLRTAVVPEAGHFLPEEAPDEVSALLLDFLATLPD